ncbi:MAG: peptidase S41, partial [Muribaculaceae bacterium]|nr:peptidase S41 [Muribaculaceae bacterium]
YILDLRGNSGGFLDVAIQMANEFLDRGREIVSTRGRDGKMESRIGADGSGTFKNEDIVVLIDEFSASASEIVAGAMQDNDRATIIGRRSFGKGLVQKQHDLSDGSAIRVTTARYYTPSGRCIQKPYEKGHGDEYRLDMLNRYNSGELWSADSIHFEDSLKVYTLKTHRTVYGGGGIMPDVFVPVDTTYFTPYYRDLVAKGIVNSFILSEVDKHRKSLLTRYPTEDDFQEHFKVDKAMEERLIEAADKDGLKFNEDEWKRSDIYVRAILKGLMARDLYDKGSYVRSTNNLNPVFVNALELIIDPERYEALIKRQD